MRIFSHCLGQEATLVVTHVPWGCTNQTRHRVALHVLRHVKTHQLDAHLTSQLLGHLGLTDTGWASKQETTNRLPLGSQACPRQFNRTGKLFDGWILPKYRHFQVTLEVFQHLGIVTTDRLGRNTRDLGDHGLDFTLADRFLAL